MENTKRIGAVSFSCEGCGGRMEFDPDTQDLFCDQCGRHEEIESQVLDAPEYLYNPYTDEYKAPDWNAMGSHAVRCSGCGAQIVIPVDSLTARCPFCSGNYVVDQNAVNIGIQPETIQPFKISRPRALDLFQKWVKSRFGAPGKFRKSSLKPDSLAGVYMPFWTYDADVETAYRGEGGERYTTTHTRVVNGKTETYTETHVRWYPLSGKKNLVFDDETVCAVREANDNLLAGIGDFNTKVLNRYSPAYLAGFTARRYDVGLGEGFIQARKSMERKMERAILNDYHYDEYRNMQYSHSFSNVRFKHILLPVWISSYKYRDKVYRFLINGETGRISGKAPVSAFKVAVAILIACAVVFGIFIALNAVGVV